MAGPSVFIGSSKEGLDIAHHIRSQLRDDAEITIFNEGVFGLNQGTLESLVNALEKFDFAILVLTPDDMIESREQISQSPRDNVLFECGLFIGKIGRDRTFIVYDSEKKIKIPSDLAGISMATFKGTRKDGNMRAAVGEACDEIRTAIKSHTVLDRDQKLIYDSRTTLNMYDFQDKENAITFDKDGQPTSPIGRGSLDFDDNGILHVKRTNVEGRFEVHLKHNGPGKPVIFKKEVLERKLRVRCEAKIEDGSEHTLRFVFKDETANKLADYRVKVKKYTDRYKWHEIDVPFRVSPMVDLTFRIDDEVNSQAPGNIKIRHLVITEELT